LLSEVWYSLEERFLSYISEGDGRSEKQMLCDHADELHLVFFLWSSNWSSTVRFQHKSLPTMTITSRAGWLIVVNHFWRGRKYQFISGADIEGTDLLVEIKERE